VSKNNQEEVNWQNEDEVIFDGTSGTRTNMEWHDKKLLHQQEKKSKVEGLLTKTCLSLGMGGMDMVEAANLTRNLFKSVSTSDIIYTLHECIHLIGGHSSPSPYCSDCSDKTRLWWCMASSI